MKPDAKHVAGASPTPGRSVRRRLATALLGALGAVVLMASPASADVPTYDTSFDGSTITPTPDNPFAPGEIAVDEATGDVWVVDTANGVIDRFSSAGVYEDQITSTDVTTPFNFGGADQLAVDNAGGAGQGSLYLATENGPLYAFESDGTPRWENDADAASCGVAIDVAGRLWSSDYYSGVQERDPADGTAIGSAFLPGQNGCGIAFDSQDALFLNSWQSVVTEYPAPAYDTGTQVESSSTSQIAVDRTYDDLYTVRLGGGIGMFDASGAPVWGAPFGAGTYTGVAADATARLIYVSDGSGGRVDVYRTAAPGPTRNLRIVRDGTGRGSVESSPAGIDCGDVCEGNPPENSRATLTATPAPGSEFTGWSGGGCSGTAPCEVTMSADVEVTATFTELPPVTLSVVRDGTGGGSVTSDDFRIDCGATCEADYPDTSIVTLTATPNQGSQFTGWSGGGCTGTDPCAVTLAGATQVTATFSQDLPFLDSERALTLTDRTATLGANVTPNGSPTTCEFEYGTTTAYGSSVPCAVNPGGGFSSVAVSSQNIRGLTADTTYHYRINATNAGGTQNGADQTFTTSAVPPPFVVSGAASAVTDRSASLAGSVVPRSYATTCWFEYGTTQAYGSRVACASNPGDGTETVPVSAAVSGLATATTYHYRLVGEGPGGVANGADRTFRTLDSPSCATDSLLCPPPPKTCANDASACKPPVGPIPPGLTELVLEASSAPVSRGRAAVKVTCTGEGSCRGEVRLVARVRGRDVVVGSTDADVPAGGLATVRVALTRTGRSLLGRTGRLTVKISGVGLDDSLVLRGRRAARRRGRARGRRGRRGRRGGSGRR